MAIVPASTRSTLINVAVASSGPFLINFRLFDVESLRILIDGVARTDWTLSAAFVDGFTDNATVTFFAPVPALSVIQIDGNMTIRREEDYYPGDPSFVSRTNVEHARHVATMQELKRDIDRADVIAAGAAADRAEAAAAQAETHYRRPRALLRSIICADIQPTSVPEVAITRTVFDDMALNHADCDDMFILGDLVDEGSVNDTGADPLYSHEDFSEDLRLRVPISRSRIFAIAGNHDRDGSGAGLHRRAWTLNAYRRVFGREYYLVKRGNLNYLMLGDMGGSTGGEIAPLVRDWATKVMATLENENVIICIHQPVAGGYDFATEDRWFQSPAASAWLQGLLSANDNVAGVFFGHVGNTLDRAMAVKEAFGCTHVNFQMGIPTAVIEGFGEYHYSVMECQRLATTATIRRWGVVAQDYLAGKDVTITFKYPLDLGVAETDFDGRHHMPERNVMIDESLTVTKRLSDTRSVGFPFTPNTGVNWIMSLATVDDALDDALTGMGTGLLLSVPGAAQELDAQGSATVITPGAGAGGGIAARRAVGTEADFTSDVVLYRSTGSGDPNEMIEAFVAGGNGTATGDVVNPGGDALPPLGKLLTVTSGNGLVAKGRITAGDLNDFYEPGIYRINSGADAAAIANVPNAGSGGVLEVLLAGSQSAVRDGANFVIQRYTVRRSNATARTYQRENNSAAIASWSDWSELVAVTGRGGNATEGFIRMSDGRMRCWKNDLTVASASTALGALFRSATVTWTHGQIFVGAVRVSGSVDDLDATVSFAAPGNTTVDLRVLSAISKASTLTIRAVAEGYWL